jgi:prefoldin subunit 5
MEEKDHELATLANKNNQLRSQLEFLQQKTKLQQSEIDTLRNVSARPEEAKQYHTFQQP